jgi:IS30 family transposase
MLFSFRQERGALMSSYTHLTHEERYQIYALKKAGLQQNEITALLGRSSSTISRKLHRNWGR